MAAGRFANRRLFRFPFEAAADGRGRVEQRQFRRVVQC